MSGINAWAASLCTVALVCTALRLLTPNNGMGRIVKMIMAAVLIAAMITPLAKLGSLFSGISASAGGKGTNNPGGQALEEAVLEQLRSSTETAVKEMVEQAFAEGGLNDISIEKVELDMDTGDDGCIYINSVTLFLDKQNMPEALLAEQTAERVLGVDVDVIRSQEGRR